MPQILSFQSSVDYLFRSVTKLSAAARTLAIILTGMGQDGAKEMLNLKKAGATTIAQNRETSLVYGMPKAAVDLKAATGVMSPDSMVALLNNFAERIGEKH